MHDTASLREIESIRQIQHSLNYHAGQNGYIELHNTHHVVFHCMHSRTPGDHEFPRHVRVYRGSVTSL